MLECNRFIRKRLSALSRGLFILLPTMIVVMLLSQLAFAETAYVIKDGDTTRVYTTDATDPAAILAQAGFELGENDRYEAVFGTGTNEIVITRAKTVNVVLDGHHQTVAVYGGTVADALQQLGITVTDSDWCSESLDAEVSDNMSVTVCTPVTRPESYRVYEPYETEYYYLAYLKETDEIVVQEGADAHVMYRDQVTYLNGTETGRENLSRVVLEEAKNRIILTGSQTLAAASIEGEAQLQTTLSELCSDGMPYIGDGVIVTSAGEILTFTSTMEVKATAYSHLDPGCDMITATGTTVRIGTVAVDPRMIPYGTKMFIVSNDGVYIYGISTAEDCGGSIKGNRVDLYMPTTKQCFAFGVRNCTIYFLG